VTLAIFDLDNTLLNGDSDHAWGEFLVEKNLVDAQSYAQANDHFYQQYQNGTLDILEFLAFSLAPLAKYSKAELDQWHAQFMEEKIRPIMQSKAQHLLEEHRAKGHLLMIITATNAFVTTPIAKALGVDVILASEPEFDGSNYTGRVAGTPCFQQGKVTRLENWLKENQHNLEGSYFYSDSHNDLPLLKLVSHPVAVDADDALSAHAKQHNWPHISLRDG
jgi:HAD superfamily hydrolase (TIGR01490 family)